MTWVIKAVEGDAEVTPSMEAMSVSPTMLDAFVGVWRENHLWTKSGSGSGREYLRSNAR